MTIASTRNMWSILLCVLLTSQHSHGFSTPRSSTTASSSRWSSVSDGLVSNIGAAWSPSQQRHSKKHHGVVRMPSVISLAATSDNNNNDEESTDGGDAPSAEEQEEEFETEASTTGLFIPGFSDQVEQPPEPEKKKEVKAVVTKEEAISNVDAIVAESKQQGGGFNFGNPFGADAKKETAPKPPTPPSPPKKLSDGD
eukprot:scaffold2045_cov203-Alexandrium_tamarense.AAC.1